MNTYYNHEANLGILISLLKKYGIKQVIASPGMTNSNFVASLQSDPFFNIYSAVDERSAAYMACGLADETHKPVIISCTGATASREWAPGLTEAFYRHLPILAITSSQPNSRVGHLIPQVTDRSRPMPDMVKMSVDMPLIYRGGVDERSLVITANEALLELSHNGGGPVHINLITNYDLDFSVKSLPEVPRIYRICHGDSLPNLPADFQKIISVRSDTFFERRIIESIDKFCEIFGVLIVTDDTDRLKGFNPKHVMDVKSLEYIDQPLLLIHLGQDNSESFALKPNEVWRVSMDGEVIDLYEKLALVFEMDDEVFFNAYITKAEENSNDNDDTVDVQKTPVYSVGTQSKVEESGHKAKAKVKRNGLFRKILKRY